MFSALAKVASWAGKRKRLLAGVVGLAVKTAGVCVPGVGLAADILAKLAEVGLSAEDVSQLAEKGVEDLLDPEHRQPISREQMEQINSWVETISTQYSSLLDHLEQLPLAEEGSLAQLSTAIERVLAGNADLVRAFDGCLAEVRRQTLSLGLIEEKLDEHFHGQQKLTASLEEIKQLFIQAPSLQDWIEFRKARPEAVAAVVAADEHFLAGRKDDGVAVLVDLLKRRGVGEATLAHHLGLVELSQGRVREARERLRQAVPTGQAPPALTGTLASLSTMSGRTGVAGWRSLPRGFRVGRKYRIETEVGRGGMASVYRAQRLPPFEKVVAIKVPAPALMLEETTRQRFVKEIEISIHLSESKHPHIVPLVDYDSFDDPFTQKEQYALVMEFVEGTSLANHLARRREAGKPLSLDEIRTVMKAVCLALEHAHGRNVLHRDLKPHNVMVGRGVVKLMDFGIARVLDDSQDGLTRPGQVLGTGIYMAPELLSGSPADWKTEIYAAGNLLLELLTLSPVGDPESRKDCPLPWLELIASSMSRLRGQRPSSMAEFRDRLLDAAKPCPPVARPVDLPVPLAPLETPIPVATPRAQTQPLATLLRQPALPREIENSIGMKLVLVPSGKFTMGSPATEAERLDNEGPQHEVEITKPFYLGIYPVTQAQYERVMGNNPSHFQLGGAHPVERVSWDEAVEFCRRLSELPEEKKRGRVYRLPTEAQWEYSCREGGSFKNPVPLREQPEFDAGEFRREIPLWGS